MTESEGRHCFSLVRVHSIDYSDGKSVRTTDNETNMAEQQPPDVDMVPATETPQSDRKSVV